MGKVGKAVGKRGQDIPGAFSRLASASEDTLRSTQVSSLCTENAPLGKRCHL